MNFRQAQKVNCPNGAREAPLEGVLPKMIEKFLSPEAKEQGKTVGFPLAPLSWFLCRNFFGENDI